MGDPSDKGSLWKRQGLPVKSDSVSDIDYLSDDSEEDTMFTSCISNIYPNVDGSNSPLQGNSHTDPSALSDASICSLESTVTLFKKHFIEFQDSFNDSWTMRETSFCQKSLSKMSDIVEKMDRFNQTYHQFVTNFNEHMLKILQLNIESLLLSTKAFIRCCSSLQYSKHNSGVALYPEELIQTMKVLIKQSIRAVDTAWFTFLQSTNCQIDEFPADHSWPQNLSSEGATELEQNETMTYNLNETDNVSPYKYIKKELFNEETFTEEPESVMKMNLYTEDAEPSSNVTSDTSGLSPVHVERLGPQNLQPPQNGENTETTPRKGDCFNSRPTFALEECSVTLEKHRHTPKIQQGTMHNHIWDGGSAEIQDHALLQNRNVTERSLQNADKRTSLTKPEEIRISKSLLASSENRSKTGKHKRKPWSKSPNKTATKKPTLESLPMESLPTPCNDRGTQTPSKLSALQTSSIAAPRGNTIIHNKNPEKKRYSKSPSEILDKPENKSKRLEQSQTISSVNHKKTTEYKDDANPSSKTDKLLLNQDHPLTTFVSSLKSYQCSPSSMHVSLQVACVERKVLARRLRIEEAKKQLEKKKSRHSSRNRPMDTRRSEKSDTSNGNKSRKSLDEKTSSTPQKRLKKIYDVNKKNSKDTISISNSSYHLADPHGKSEKDSNNNTTEQDVQNSNNLVPENKKCSEPVSSQQNCVNKGCKTQSTHQIGPLMLLKDEDQFFLNQQADLTARIKSMRKMKTNSGGNLPSSTPNHTPDQADDVHKQQQKYPDPNNNA